MLAGLLEAEGGSQVVSDETHNLGLESVKVGTAARGGRRWISDLCDCVAQSVSLSLMGSCWKPDPGITSIGEPEVWPSQPSFAYQEASLPEAKHRHRQRHFVS